jgi:hypothetical protein
MPRYHRRKYPCSKNRSWNYCPEDQYYCLRYLNDDNCLIYDDNCRVYNPCFRNRNCRVLPQSINNPIVWTPDCVPRFRYS